MGQVAVAMANWNGMQYIGRCLEAVFAQTNPVGQVVVVDNASTDGSREWIRAHFPQVEVLENGSNEGFAAGCNRAIDACQSPFVLVLNTDVFLQPDFVEQLLEGLAPDVGAATGCFYEQANSRWVNGGFYMRRQMRILPSANTQRPEAVFGATGAGVLFRRAALEDAAVDGEYFDASYFMYGEDIDLSWRLQLLGWKVQYLPGARAQHIGSGSLDGRFRFVDKPAFLQRHILKNRHLTVIKNASPALLVRLSPWLVLTELLVWGYFLLRHPLRLPNLVGGWIDVVRLLPALWRKRRHIQARRQVAPSYIRRFFVKF